MEALRGWSGNECYCENIDPDTWRLMVGQDYSNAGYAWVFPLSRNRVRIGIGNQGQNRMRIHCKNCITLWKSDISRWTKSGKIQPIEFHYGFIPNQEVS